MTAGRQTFGSESEPRLNDKSWAVLELWHMALCQVARLPAGYVMSKGMAKLGIGPARKISFDGAQAHLEDLKPEHLVFNQATPR